MTQKVFELVKGILTGCEVIAVAVVSYCCEPAVSAMINSAIVIGVKAAIDICEKFKKD